MSLKSTDYYECLSNEHRKVEIESSSQLGVSYTVRFDNAHNMRGDERDFSCTCKGYEMQQARDGYCKHIHLARKSYCGWKQYHNGGEPIHRPYDGGVESFCPKCELFAYLSPYAPLVDKELIFICPSCGDTDKVRPATVNQSMQCTFPVVNPAECDGRALSVKVEMLLPLKADLK